MKKNSLVLIILTLVFLLIFSSMLFYRYYYFKGSQSLEMQFETAEKLGFNTDTDALFFGKGIPGTQTKRNLQINNSYDFPVNVMIKTEGNIKPFVSVSKNNFFIDAKGSTVITYYVQTSKDTPYSNFSGYTTLVFTRPLFN